MSQVATMSVKLDADILQWEKNLDKADKVFLKSAKNIEKTGKELSLFVTAPLLGIGAAMTKFAADDEAAMLRFSRIFGPATQSMKAFEAQALKSIPSTVGEMDQLLASTQNFIAQMGIAPRAATALTQQLATMAGDIAAFNGVGIDQAMDALEKGIAGKTRGLVSLGIVITEQSVKQEAYRLGLAKTGAELSDSAKAEATLSLIRSKAANQMGEAARTADNAANSMKFLKAATEEMLGEWGKELIPVTTSAVHGLTDLARTVGDLPTPLKDMALGVGVLAASVGPLLILTGSLIRNFKELNAVLKVTAGAEGLLGIARVGAAASVVLAPLAAFAALFWKSGEAARGARAEVDQFTASLAGMTKAQLDVAAAGAQRGIVELDTDVAALRRRRPQAPKGPSGFSAGKGAGFEGSNGEDPQLERQIRAVELQHDKLMHLLAAIRTAQATPPPAIIPGGTGGTAADKQAEVVAALAREVEDIAKMGAPLPAMAQDAYSAIGAALATLAKLGDEFHRRKGESSGDFKARTDEIHQLQEALGKLTEIKIPELHLPDVGAQVDAWLSGTVERASKAAMDAVPKEQLQNAFLQPLRDAVDAATVQAARLSIENAGREAHGKAPVDVDKAMAAARKTIADLSVDLKHAVDAMNLPGTPAEALLVKKALLEEIDKLLKSIGAAAPKVETNAQKIAGAIGQVSSALRGMADLANALGDSKLGNLLNTTANFADNASKAVASGGKDVGADIGTLSSGIALVTQLLSDPSKTERNAVTKANTEALKQVTLKLAGFAPNASNTVDAFHAITAFFGDTPALNQLARNQTHQGGFLGTQTKGNFQTQLDAMLPSLTQFGLTFDELTAIAKQYGITLTDKDGRITYDALVQFRDHILGAAQAAFQFNKSLSSDQKSYLDIRDKLAGKTTPQDDYNRSIELIHTMAAKLLPAGLDPSTDAGRAYIDSKAGRDAIRAALLSDVDRAKAGQIPLGDFGNFQNINDFVSAAGGAADGLNALDDATNNVVAALTNVPTGFKIATDRFLATIPTLPSIPGASPVVPGTDTFGPIMLPTPTTPMYPTPSNSGSASPSTITFGDIITTVTVPEGVTDPDAIAASVTTQVIAQVVPQIATLLQQQAARGGASSFAVASRQMAV